MGDKERRPATLMSFFFKRISSALVTTGLMAAFALYLGQGKIFSTGLNPRIVLFLGMAVVVQTLLALGIRLSVLFGRTLPLPFHAIPLRITVDDAEALFKRRGYDCMAGEGGVRRFTRYWKASQLIAIGVYLSLLFIMTAGCLNFGFGVGGHIDLSPDGEETKFATLQLERGYLVTPRSYPFLLRLGSLLPATGGEPSQAILAVRQEGEGTKTEHRLSPGDVFYLGRVSVRYQADYFIAFIKILRNEHDYLAKPLLLYPDLQGGYSGELGVAEPRVTGKGKYEPGRGRFTIEIMRDGKEEYRGSFRFADRAENGGFSVFVPAMLHAAKFEVSRFGYRREIVTAFAILAGLMVLRLLCRGGMIEISRDKDGQVYGRATSKSLLRALL